MRREQLSDDTSKHTINPATKFKFVYKDCSVCPAVRTDLKSMHMPAMWAYSML